MNDKLNKGSWGASEPSATPQARLRLDFGLRPAILAFNEWAVPGLGGAFFVRQLSWACAGLRLARDMGQLSMAAKYAEGLEALASFIVQTGRGGELDDRVQGKRKFQNRSSLSFAAVHTGGAYVTVPFRRSATAALPGLGFCRQAEARFNALRLSEAGEELASFALPERAGRLLRAWIDRGSSLSKVDQEIKQALVPSLVSKAESMLVERQLLADPRRACLLRSMAAITLQKLESPQGQASFLKLIEDDVHRVRLDACFSFERLRKAALQAGQSLATSVEPGRMRWQQLSNVAEINDSFGVLSEACAELAGKLDLLQDVSASIINFCAEQSGDAQLVGRIRALAERLPLILAVLDDGIDKTDQTGALAAADAFEATEEDQFTDASAVPRPLLRLQRFNQEIRTGIEHGA